MSNYELEQELSCKQMEVEDLRQQLAECQVALKANIQYPKGWHHREVVALEKRLAECQAALEIRDKVLRDFRDSVLFRIGSSSPYRGLAADYFEQIKETLAIQPGTEALKAWLGEPVGHITRGTHGATGTLIKHDDLQHGTPLYSPKGLK